MKIKIITLLFFSLMACNSTEKLTSNQQELATIKKAFPEAPQCILDKIAVFQKEPKANPPRKIYQYQYKGNTVYYISAPCCDIYPELLDANCNLLCAPDGGFTGKGDGKCLDFNKTKSKEKLIWRDKREK